MSLLGNIINYKMQQDQLAAQQEHTRKSALTQTLLDRVADPNTTPDEQAVLYNEIGTLMGGGKGKGKSNSTFGGPVGSLIGLFLHHDHAGTDVHDNPLAGLVGQAQKRNENPVSQGTSEVPSRIEMPLPDAPATPQGDYGEIRMPAPAPSSVQGGTAVNESPTYSVNPTRRYGSMTLGEIADARKLGLYSQQQDILDKRDIANDERTKQLRLAEVTEKAKAAAERQSQRFENNLSLVDAREAAQARKEMDSAVLRIKAADPTVTDDQARALAGQQLNGQIESLIEQRKASASLSTARALSEPIKVQIMQRNAATNERRAQTYEIKTQADIDKMDADVVAGLTPGQERDFKIRTEGLRKERDTAIETIARLQEKQATYQTTPAASDPLIATFQKRVQDLTDQIAAARESLNTSTVPRRQRGGVVPNATPSNVQSAIDRIRQRH